MSEIPRRITSTNIFTLRSDDFNNLGLSIASLPPPCIKFSDPLSQIEASVMIYSGRFITKPQVEI